jgi:aspartate racemase
MMFTGKAAQTKGGDSRSQTVGVLGGVGPRASAEFLKTIYEFSRHTFEQEAPRIMLISDPTYPDRTEALINGEENALVEKLTSDLKTLDKLGARPVVICCLTLHYALPHLPDHLRLLVVPLLDVALDRVISCGQKQLLLCTNGTRRMGIFESHPLWPRASDLIIAPEPHDQDAIHKLIYRLKQNDCVEKMIPEIDALMTRYGVSSFLAGCTEIHLLVREAARRGPAYRDWSYVDPLTIIAEAIGLGARHSHGELLNCGRVTGHGGR